MALARESIDGHRFPELFRVAIRLVSRTIVAGFWPRKDALWCENIARCAFEVFGGEVFGDREGVFRIDEAEGH